MAKDALSSTVAISTVVNEHITPFVSIDSICYNAVIKYLHQPTKSVENEIKNSVPHKLCLLFHGWSNGSLHIICHCRPMLGMYVIFSGSSPLKTKAH